MVHGMRKSIVIKPSYQSGHTQVHGKQLWSSCPVTIDLLLKPRNSGISMLHVKCKSIMNLKYQKREHESKEECLGRCKIHRIYWCKNERAEQENRVGG